MRSARNYADEIPETITAGEIAKVIHCSERNVKDRVSKTPEFPKALKFGNTRVWVKSEFSDWFLQQRES